MSSKSQLYVLHNGYPISQTRTHDIIIFPAKQGLCLWFLLENAAIDSPANPLVIFYDTH